MESTRASVDQALGTYNDMLESLQAEHTASLQQVASLTSGGAELAEHYQAELAKKEQLAEGLRRELAKKAEHVKVMQVKKAKAEELAGGLQGANQTLESHLNQQKTALLAAAARLAAVEEELVRMRSLAEQKSQMEDALNGAYASLKSPRSPDSGEQLSPPATGTTAVSRLARRAAAEKAGRLTAQEEVARYEGRVEALLASAAENEEKAAATLAVVQAARDEVLAAQSEEHADLSPARTIRVLSTQARAQHKMQAALDDVRHRLERWDAAAANLTPSKAIAAIGEQAAQGMD
eukprot:2590386-Pyramimonas_sp.AAC.1